MGLRGAGKLAILLDLSFVAPEPFHSDAGCENADSEQRSFLPEATFWTTVVAVLGTTISPYLFFWQAAQEAEDIRVEPERKPLLKAPRQGPDAIERIVVSPSTAFPFDDGISEQRTQLWILAGKVNDRVGGRLMISTEFLHRRRLDNLQRGILRECCKRCEFGAASTTGTP